jgi:hypothetical protein
MNATMQTSQEIECSCSGPVAQRIDAIFNALPAPNRAAIAERTSITQKDIENALTHLRSHSVEHGWTVPHSTRGEGTGGDRFFAMLIGPDGTYIDAGTHDAINRGGLSTLREASTKVRNEAMALRATAEHQRGKVQKRRLRDLADDFDYVARKADSAALELVEA